MAQNINLLNPALLPQPGPLSAQRLLTICGLAVVACVALSLALEAADRAARAAHAAQVLRDQAERDSLRQHLAALPPVQTPEALGQEVAQLEAELGRRQQLHDLLQEGQLKPSRQHGALLRLLASATHPGVWLTSVQVGAGQVHLEGQALQSPALRDWAVNLNQAAYFEGRPLEWLQLERAVPKADAADAPPAKAPAPRLKFQLGTAEPAALDRSRP